MSRASIVKMYMKEHPGVSLPMASKAVKEKGLYVAKSSPMKAKSGSKKTRKAKGGMKVAVTVSSTKRRPKKTTKARKAKSGSKKSKK